MSAAHVRHELRTPLNAIIGYSEMILDDVVGNLDATALLTKILATADSMLKTIDLVSEHLNSSCVQPRGEVLAQLLLRIDADRETVAGCLAGLRVGNGMDGAINDDLDAIEKACGKLGVLTSRWQPGITVIESYINLAISA